MEGLKEAYGKQKIMVVDDSAANVTLLDDMLNKNGYKNVRTLTDSRFFNDIYETFEPDLLLLDLNMPHVDGFEILQQLKERNVLTVLPVIIIAARNDMENKHKALELGAQDSIAKPFRNIEVLARIRDLLAVRILYKKLQEYSLELEQKAWERTKEIEEMQVELIGQLMCAVEFCDNDTGHHIARIGMYTYILGKALGFSETEAYHLMNASKMHDIGKIGIPDRILLKPGRLDSEEWEKMKTHAVKGAHILQNGVSEIVRLAEQIALTHHEWWDGSGYPGKLKEEQIPVCGRITALADVFDALMTVRTYKKAWPFEDVKAYICSQRGRQFDPQVVDAFLQHQKEFLDAHLNFRKEEK